jgi:hypothetical protein
MTLTLAWYCLISSCKHGHAALLGSLCDSPECMLTCPVPCCREVFYWSGILKGGVNNTRQWQFVQDNGPDALFEGYKLSLDLMASNTFQMLSGLHSVLLVLLVVEAVVVNVLALSYLFLLLKTVGAQHMRCFAPFLALPSAVMRTMASRPCKVGCRAGHQSHVCTHFSQSVMKVMQ